MQPPRTRHGRSRRIAGRAQGRHREDPYIERHKPSEPSCCRQCGSVFRKGRWQWGEPPEDATESTCPACHRTNDDYPAGIVTLQGEIVRTKRAELVKLIRHQEELEKAEHPLNRIMAIDDTDGDTITVTTTDIHLPRRIGEAVDGAYHGRLELDYDEDRYFVRVEWSKAR